VPEVADRHDPLPGHRQYGHPSAVGGRQDPDAGADPPIADAHRVADEEDVRVLVDNSGADPLLGVRVEQQDLSAASGGSTKSPGRRAWSSP
jgi:hypothetical protein